MRRTYLLLMLMAVFASVGAVDLTRCKIVSSPKDAPLVGKMAGVLADDVERVSGVRPARAERVAKGDVVVLATIDHLADLGVKLQTDELRGGWERYKIVTKGRQLIIAGSDPRGLAYGALHVSECIGVSPWYWWADVAVPGTNLPAAAAAQNPRDYSENFLSKSPSVKFRGIFINDEDWGLKTWAAETFETDLRDIGPKTYDKVCELLLRLRCNMLAPAMHSCTGAFYSHPESQRVADSWGIMITTSHCEPMLFNNAAYSEWNKQRDGEWNYLTNRETIWRKFDGRLRDTAPYDNIYTMGMRGLHDEAMKGSTDPRDRARTLEQVMADQREILQRHKRLPADQIPQIFVPYKETLDTYDAGLRVPDDITLVWPDDNYGYMKRVSTPDEQRRSGRSGVYYHLSYLGTPHDNLWIQTTAPALMYEELRKAYEAGADRYWLLNVGDIKPMELGIQQFFAMAWDMSAFTYDNANRYQSHWLASLFGAHCEPLFQQMLDSYYRLAWRRKPEFMGFEWQWSGEEYDRLHDTDFSFDLPADAPCNDNSALQRLAEYDLIAHRADSVEHSLPEALRPAFFEILGYSIKSANQMNRKFLYAQRNHETGDRRYAELATAAFDSLQALVDQYNGLLGGKWRQMMSQIPPGLNAKYHLMPELVSEPTQRFRLPAEQRFPSLRRMLDLQSFALPSPFRLIEGLGLDWHVVQMGQPFDAVEDPASLASTHLDLALPALASTGDSLSVCVSVVPVWPVGGGRSNRFGVSLDGCTPVVCENPCEEWSFPWKLQVIENRKDFLLRLPLDHRRSTHTLTLVVGDPGQMIQRITFGL